MIGVRANRRASKSLYNVGARVRVGAVDAAPSTGAVGAERLHLSAHGPYGLTGNESNTGFAVEVSAALV